MLRTFCGSIISHRCLEGSGCGSGFTEGGIHRRCVKLPWKWWKRPWKRVEASAESTSAELAKASMEASMEISTEVSRGFRERFHGSFHYFRGSFHGSRGSFHGSGRSFHGSGGSFHGNSHGPPQKNPIVDNTVCAAAEASARIVQTSYSPLPWSNFFSDTPSIPGMDQGSL